MKIFHFHLMPYAHMDLGAIRKAGTAWVTLSNQHYDPIKGAELYNEYLDQMEFADELGFDGLVVNEHHQTAYGLMPSPGVMAGALGGRIKNTTRSEPIRRNRRSVSPRPMTSSSAPGPSRGPSPMKANITSSNM